MRMKRPDNRYVTLFCFVPLFILMEMFHSKLGIYFDDYGNASLSYGYDAGVSGLTWSLSDLLQWASWIYFNFSGRIMCGSMLNLLVKAGNGPHLFMAIQAGVLVLLFYIMYRIVLFFTKQKCNVILLILMIALFFQMPSDMYRWNLCWASASVLYIWPLLPFFAAIYVQMLQDNGEEKKRSVRILYDILATVCIMYAAFSHEQTGFSIAVYMVVYFIYRWLIEKRFKVRNLIYAVVAAATYAFLFFAPGNWNRMDGNTEFSSLSFLEKIEYNFEQILSLLFSDEFLYVYVLITVLLVFITYEKAKKTVSFYLAVSSLVLLVLHYAAGRFSVPFFKTVVEMVYLLVVFASLLLYHYERRRNSLTIMLVASAASAFCVLISPTLPIRCFTEWILVLHVVFMLLMYDAWCKVREFTCKNCRALAVCTGIVVGLNICWQGAEQFALLYIGYSGHVEYLKENDSILGNYDGKETVYLLKLRNAYYSPAMPYDEGFEFIEYWMKQYYDIPQDVRLVWADCDTDIEKLEKSISMEGEFFVDGWFGSTGEIVVEDSQARQLNLICTVPENWGKEQSVIIAVNGEEEEYALKQGENIITLKIKYGQNNVINISALDAKRLSEKDARECSFMVSYYFDKISQKGE